VSLFGDAPPEPDVHFGGLRRHHLDATTWIDHAPGWLRGSDVLFDELAETLPWRQRQVPMYGRIVAEPRLTWWWTTADGSPPMPVLDGARTLLSEHYGVPFDSIGFNLYRTGEDSVAWHSDRKGPPVADPTVAIVSAGEPRVFRMRPKGGGRSVTFALGSGDLLVMGGACQDRWEHSVPKVRRAGPRMSITFRHSGVH
jgi:alkylated DNA repair dioxygenase AlkB